MSRTESCPTQRAHLATDRSRSVAALARVLDPLAYDDRAEQCTLGQVWERTQRQMLAEQYARRAIEAGWIASREATS